MAKPAAKSLRCPGEHGRSRAQNWGKATPVLSCSHGCPGGTSASLGCSCSCTKQIQAPAALLCHGQVPELPRLSSALSILCRPWSHLPLPCRSTRRELRSWWEQRLSSGSFLSCSSRTGCVPRDGIALFCVCWEETPASRVYWGIPQYVPIVNTSF